MAETIRAETSDTIHRCLPERIQWNRFYRALSTLRALDLVVRKSVKYSDDLLELHPVIREFVRSKFTRPEREPFIMRMALFFDEQIARWKPQLGKVLSLTVLEHWIVRVELALNAGQFQEAILVLADAALPLVDAGYTEEFVRVASRLCRELDWHEAILNEYRGLEPVLTRLCHALADLGRVEEVDWILAQYEAALLGKGAQFVHLCALRCYALWARGDHVAAVEWGERGETTKSESDLDTGFDCSHSLALARRDVGRVQLALDYFLRGTSIESVLSDEAEGREEDGAFFGNIGRCLWLLGDTDGALRCYRRSAEILEKQRTFVSLLNRGHARFWIGQALEGRGDVDLALAFYRAAVAQWRGVRTPRAAYAFEAFNRLLRQTGQVQSDNVLEAERAETICRQWILNKL